MPKNCRHRRIHHDACRKGDSLAGTSHFARSRRLNLAPFHPVSMGKEVRGRRPDTNFTSHPANCRAASTRTVSGLSGLLRSRSTVSCHSVFEQFCVELRDFCKRHRHSTPFAAGVLASRAGVRNKLARFSESPAAAHRAARGASAHAGSSQGDSPGYAPRTVITRLYRATGVQEK
jgi:hypothetical protein